MHDGISVYAGVRTAPRGGARPLDERVADCASM
jgi:hypothetical protein